MNFTDYHQEFDTILAGENTNKPYDDSHFMEYVKLNHSRQNRWLKKGILQPNTISTIQSITEKQTWVLITEPWCGDAAHIVPFVQKMAELNPVISLVIQQRDSKESEIDNYMTNGGKAIPKVIVRNEDGTDLFNWGPRPEACQALFLQSKEKDLTIDEQKTLLQQWYNADQGIAIQEEITQLIATQK